MPLETEDLIDVAAYLGAVNQELKLWNASPPEITSADIGPSLRTKDVAKWCAKNEVACPDKVAVAERVLDATFKSDPDASGEAQAYAATRRDVIQNLRAELVGRLGLT